MLPALIDLLDISIHALVKRATSFGSLDIERLNISIHALVKRATLSLFSLSAQIQHFNPRPREEGDNVSASFFIL